jgi:pyrroloquinoline quinone (PQQ) biosynthesis protein C
MAPSTEEFAGELAREVRARRSFGGHPFWHRVEQGAVSRPALQTFANQLYLQVYEFPRAVSALHSRPLDAGERIHLAESLYEEKQEGADD